MHVNGITRPATLGDQVAASMRRQIITQQISAGTLLVETRLAEEFAVSRGPIRDAIRTLIQEGLVTTKGRSASVIGLDAHDIDEVFTLRSALETQAMRFAVATGEPKLLRLQMKALEDMRASVAANDVTAFTYADLLFHDSYYVASGHRRISDVADQYRPTVENLLLVSNRKQVDLAPSLQKHEVLYGLALQGDPGAIATELQAHLNSARMRVRGEYLGGELNRHITTFAC